MANINTALKLGFPLSANLGANTLYTPSYSASLGTIADSQVYQRQVGDKRHISGRFTIGTATAAIATMGLPNAEVVAVGGGAAQRWSVGIWTSNNTNASQVKTGPILALPGDNFLTFGTSDSTGTVGGFVPQNANALFAAGQIISIEGEVIVPTTALVGQNVSSGGSGGSSTTYEEVAVSKTAVSGTRYLYNLLAGPYTLTLPSGTTAATVSFQDRAGLASPTKYLRIDPGASNSIDSFNNGDTVDMDYANFSGTVNRAANSSVWYRVKQLTSTVQPGAQSGYNGGNAIAAGYIGEVITWAVSPSTLVLTTSLADWPNATLALTAGVWLIRADVQAQAATGTTSGNNTYSVAQLTDSANNVIQGNSSRVDATTAGAASTLVGATISLSALVNISASASYKIRGMKVDNVGTGSGQLRNQSDAFSRFFAVRIA